MIKGYVQVQHWSGQLSSSLCCLVPTNDTCWRGRGQGVSENLYFTFLSGFGIFLDFLMRKTTWPDHLIQWEIFPHWIWSKSSQTFIVDTTVLWSQVAFNSKISNFHHIQTSGRMDRPTKKWGNLKCPWQSLPTWNEEEWWWMEALKATFPAAPLSRDLHFVKSHAMVRIRMIKWPTSKKQKETFILSHFLMQDISKADALNGRTKNTFKMFFFIFLLCFPMQDIS